MKVSKPLPVEGKKRENTKAMAKSQPIDKPYAAFSGI